LPIIISPLSFSLAFILILAIYCYDEQVMVQAGDTTIPPSPSKEASS
jgi:hypothetical protein